MNIKLASVALAGAALTMLLSSCSSDPDTQSPKPSASKSASAAEPTLAATPGAAYELENKVIAPCTDGTARIETANAETTVEGDCDNVIIGDNAGWSLIYLKGAVQHLTVNANLAGVYGADLHEVVINGDGNDITHTGSKPTVKDEGDNNRVSNSEQG